MIAWVEEAKGVCPASKVCDAIALARRTYYSWKSSSTQTPSPVAMETIRGLRKPNPSSAPHPRSLSLEQKEHALAVLNSPRFFNQSASQAYATLLDEGRYLCSERVLYRLLAAQGQTTPRYQRPSRNAKKPELLATGPGQLWSWDITKLKAAEKWSYYYLYVIMDVFSRYAVGWMVAHRESTELAKTLISECCLKQGIVPGRLTLHADRGSSMTSKGVGELLMDLGVTKSHSRPHVSNDNPYSEAQFKTLKYRPEFPERFGSIEESRNFCRVFFPWYNTEHRHSGLAHFTPHDVHYGLVERKQEVRNAALLKAYAEHPERFVKGIPYAAMPEREVWINKPIQEVNKPESLNQTTLNTNELLCKKD
jgi:putative transposase